MGRDATRTFASIAATSGWEGPFQHEQVVVAAPDPTRPRGSPRTRSRRSPSRCAGPRCASPTSARWWRASWRARCAPATRSRPPESRWTCGAADPRVSGAFPAPSGDDPTPRGDSPPGPQNPAAGQATATEGRVGSRRRSVVCGGAGAGRGAQRTLPRCLAAAIEPLSARSSRGSSMPATSPRPRSSSPSALPGCCTPTAPRSSAGQTTAARSSRARRETAARRPARGCRWTAACADALSGGPAHVTSR